MMLMCRINRSTIPIESMSSHISFLYLCSYLTCPVFINSYFGVVSRGKVVSSFGVEFLTGVSGAAIVVGRIQVMGTVCSGRG